jgi:diphosphomevalonate decarboxylase
VTAIQKWLPFFISIIFMLFNNPNRLLPKGSDAKGQIAWRSPSNIAIIKYWGKHGRQLPRNPNISFTLRDAFTMMTMDYQVKTVFDNKISLDFVFEDPSKNDKFKAKIVAFMESILDIFPFLTQLDMRLTSFNSFPHSAGIASSASSMSALALCLCSLESRLFEDIEENSLAFLKKASFIARLASGSACRSVYPKMAVWGKMKDVKGSSDEYAVPFETSIHDIFKSYHDSILIVDNTEKSVSSRMGHGLMENNPYSKPRYKQAHERMDNVLAALKAGDVDTFGQIAEDEALTLHALMMTSSPSFTLLKPNTLKMIEILRGYRQETKTPVYFSLDAGPNLHILYPHNVENDVKNLITEQLMPLCVAEGFQAIHDEVGNGATLK